MSRAFSSRIGLLAVGLVGLAAAALTVAAIIGPARVNADHGVPHGTILARAAFTTPTDIKIKSTLGDEKRVINVNDAADVIVQNVTVAAGAQTGWHSHHGPVVVVVTSGTMTLYQADDPTCTGETFTAGEAFVDPGQGNAHNARNEGSTEVSLYATYFDVPAGLGPAIAHPNPGTCTGF